MRHLLYIIPLVIAATDGAARTPVADVVCDSRAALEKRLTQTYGATRQGQGIRDPDTVMELWAVPKTGSWTIVQRYANGTSCIVALGEAWEATGADADPT